jgi:Glycosyltransferase 61
MAHTKPAWRRVLTGRYLRWALLRSAVLAVPPLGRRIGFFPRHVGLVEAADRVLVDERRPVPAAALLPDLTFLRRCAAEDLMEPGCRLPDGAVEGRRTVLFRRPWVDMATGAILLPGRGRTVLARGGRVSWNAASIRLRRPRVPVAARVFAPVPTHNYFHLLLENGIRLLDLLEVPEIEAEPLTVLTRPPASRVERAMYDGLTRLHPRLTLLEAPPEALALPEEAVGHFTAGNYWEWAPVTRALADRLAAAFAAVYGPPPAWPGPSGERLYLARRGAKLRAAANEDALIEALAERGFLILSASDANHPEQIARFRAARLVVAPHGAGLTNLLFARPGARVVEIFPENFAKSTYWWLARRMGLGYTPVFGGPGDYHLRFVVDIERVLRAIGTDGN